MLKYRLRRIEALLDRIAKTRRSTPALAPRQLQTAQDVIDLLQEQVEAIRQDVCAGPLEKARTIAHLAGVARKAIEAGILSARMEMLRTVLKQRKEQSQS
jgi:hypothetical protein